MLIVPRRVGEILNIYDNNGENIVFQIKVVCVACNNNIIKEDNEIEEIDQDLYVTFEYKIEESICKLLDDNKIGNTFLLKRVGDFIKISTIDGKYLFELMIKQIKIKNSKNHKIDGTYEVNFSTLVEIGTDSKFERFTINLSEK